MAQSLNHQLASLLQFAAQSRFVAAGKPAGFPQNSLLYPGIAFFFERLWQHEGECMRQAQFTSRIPGEPSQSRLSRIERWGSLLGGAALAAYGIKRRSLGGAA